MNNLLAQILAEVRVISIAMSKPWQGTTTSAHATITISKDAILESVIPPTMDVGVESMSLDTTAMGIARMSPVYHAGDKGLLEGNPSTSDTKMN